MRKTIRKKNKHLTNRSRRIKNAELSNQKLMHEAEKNTKKKIKPKVPDITDHVPVKDRSLQESEQRKQRAKDLRDAQNSRRLKLQLENRGLDDLLNEAVQKGKDFEKNTPDEKEREIKSNSSNFKSYFKDLKKVVDLADVVLEVLDARDPLGSRCAEIEEMVVSSGKKLVLVLNKIDLIPRSNLESWLKYLRQELPTVAFKASTQSQNSNLSQSKVAAIHISESLQHSSRCVGASFLMKMLGNYCRNKDIQTFIKVGVVGFPNVGKSSVINSLKRARSCSVGATAGVTKSVQEVSLDKHIKILDSPGVVFAKDGSSETLALRNAVKIETLKDVIAPAEAIFQRADPTRLCLHYNVPKFFSCHEFLGLLAKAMGKYKKGGIPHIEEAARRLINDWNRGVIKYYTHPPEEYKPSIHISSSFVTEMGKAFDISALEEQMELDSASEIFQNKNMDSQPAELKVDKEELEDMEADVKDKKVTVVFAPKKTNKNSKVADNDEPSINELQKNRMIKKKFKQMKRDRKKREESRRKKIEEEDEELKREEDELIKEEEEFEKMDKEASDVAQTIEGLSFN